MMLRCTTIIFLIFTVGDVFGYKYFQNLMPNGDNVRHSCFVNNYWAGVGHFNQKGGGPRNPFGVDFKKAGNRWTRELCMKDSDGDGMTNGEEMGDPACNWTPGKVPSRTNNITNPGVCEPIDSFKCLAKNEPGWKICKRREFICNATKQPNVTDMVLRFPPTKVPKKITNYYCQAFSLNITHDRDYHLIATEPVINNTNVMHHILVFGCSQKPASSLFAKPYQCGMGGYYCNTILGGWTLGSPGECSRNHSGIRVGKNGFKYVVMQLHWNNPREKSTYLDSSGIKLYFTSDLRATDSSIILVGQRYLAIPPRKSAYLQEVTCSSNCTKRKLPHPIYIDSILPHMHNAGRFSQVSVYRDNKLIKHLVPYQSVRYDDPQTIILNPPFELKPGDAVYMKCVYKTSYQNNSIYYGDATADEMCYGFLRYFPAQTKLSYCLNYGPIDMCTLNDVENGGNGVSPGRIGNCSNVAVFVFHTLPNYWGPKLTEFCDYSIDVCRPGCKVIVKELSKNPCWQGWSRKYIEFMSSYRGSSMTYLRTFRLQVMPCMMEIELEQKLGSKPPPIKPTSMPKPSGPLKNEQITIIIIVAAIVAGIIIIGLVCFVVYRLFIYQPTSSKQTVYLTNAQYGFDNMAVTDTISKKY